MLNSKFICAMLIAATQSRAQGVVSGTIRSDQGRKLPGVEIAIAGVERTFRSDSNGAFRLVLRAGAYLLGVRAVGYFTSSDSIEIEDNVELIHDFTLSNFGITLDTVSTTAPRAYVSAGLRGFEKRRKTHMGKYIAEAEMRKADGRLLPDLLRKVPGLMLVPGRGTSYYAASTRHQGGPGGVIQGSRGRTQPACFVTVYLDGIILFDSNLMNFDTRTLAGVEFYTGGASVPSEFRHNECGLLLLWTRER